MDWLILFGTSTFFLVSVIFSSAALCLTFSRNDDMVPAANALISYLTEPVTNSPVGEPFRWDPAPSPAAPCSVPFVFVHSVPLLICPDSPLPLLTCSRMKRRGTSLVLWLPQRARIRWISHHSDAHVVACIFLQPWFVILMLLCASRLCVIQLEGYCSCFYLSKLKWSPYHLCFTCTCSVFLYKLASVVKVLLRHHV